MLGATLFSHHTRESVLIGAKFFRDDLPYFVEVLSEVATQTKYLGEPVFCREVSEQPSES